MQHRTKRVLWIAAALCAAGCAKSDFFADADERAMRLPSASQRANAKDEKPPKILPDTYFASGMLAERQGQFDQAILQYRKAVALNHNFVAAYHRLGLLQSNMGRHLESTESLRRAVALRPDNAILRNDLGFELMKAQRWDEAEGELRRAIELKPDLASAHINLALVHAKFERFTDSLASFQTVLPDADAYYNLGLMYRGQKRYAEAAMTFRRVLAIDPEFSAATIQLERLAMNVETSKSQRMAAETPGIQLDGSLFAEVAPERPLELFADRNVPTQPDPEQEDGEYAVENPHAWGTTLADLAAILAVLDAQPGRDSADEPCDEEIMMPSVMPAEDNTVTLAEPVEAERSADADEESDRHHEDFDAVADLAGPPAPCDSESEEVDADDVIAALPSDPNTEPMGLGDSWVMLDELESKVALLWFETEALRTEKAHFSDWTLWSSLQQPSPSYTENASQRDPMVFGIPSMASPDQEDSDDSDVPFVEFQEEDAPEQEAPPASNEAREERREVPSPSERAQLWTTEFGELNSLHWIVRNETDCLGYLDAASLELLALNEENGPWCVEDSEQAASIVPQEFIPEVSNGSESGEDHEPTARSNQRTRNGFAAHQRGLEPLPD